jgi:hypothetical protein
VSLLVTSAVVVAALLYASVDRLADWLDHRSRVFAHRLSQGDRLPIQETRRFRT